MIVRREIPHPGAQLTFTDIDGRRVQAFITNQTDPDICYLEALQRGRGRAENRRRSGVGFVGWCGRSPVDDSHGRPSPPDAFNVAAP